MDILKSIIARIFNNPTSTLSAIVPIIVAVVAKWGWSIDTATLTEILSALYAIILLFLKDNKAVQSTAPTVDKATVATTAPTGGNPATLDTKVDSIVGRPGAN